METITQNTRIEFAPETYRGLSDSEKTKRIYANSIVLQDNTDYRKIVLEFTFENVNNIPDTIQIYCFNPKTKIEKEIFAFFSFPSHNLLSPYQKQKSNKLTVDIDSNFDGENFSIENDYLVDRIGFHIDNVKSNVLFSCKTFTKE